VFLVVGESQDGLCKNHVRALVDTGKIPGERPHRVERAGRFEEIEV